jgi:hypothetical protein
MSEYATFSAANAFAFELPLSSAPTIPFALTEADGTAIPEPGLAGATIWFMIKADDNDADADALVSLSTGAGTITITDAAASEGQLEFQAASLVESSTLKARVYPAFFKVKLSTGEIRTYGGQAAITPAGVAATS